MARGGWCHPIDFGKCWVTGSPFDRDVNECLTNEIALYADSEREIKKLDEHMDGRRFCRTVPDTSAKAIFPVWLKIVRRNLQAVVKKLDVGVIPCDSKSFRHEIALRVDHRVRSFVSVRGNFLCGCPGMTDRAVSFWGSLSLPTNLPQDGSDDQGAK